MTLAKLHELFSYGIITDIKAIKDVLNRKDGWWRLEFTINDEVHTQLYTARGEPKVYKTLESALHDVNRIKGMEELDSNEVISLL